MCQQASTLVPLATLAVVAAVSLTVKDFLVGNKLVIVGRKEYGDKIVPCLCFPNFDQPLVPL